MVARFRGNARIDPFRIDSANAFYKCKDEFIWKCFMTARMISPVMLSQNSRIWNAICRMSYCKIPEMQFLLTTAANEDDIDAYE